MAKKKGDWKTAIFGAVKGQILNRIKDYFDKLNDAIVITQKKIIRTLASSILMILGIIFLIIGGSYYLTDVLKYSRSTVYLLAGLVLVLISVILAQSAKLLKYEFK